MLWVVGGGWLVAEEPPTKVFVLDDFSQGARRSRVGTAWEAFTDGVMGGRSRMTAGIVTDSTAPYLRMTGDVSLENNGGFIQVRLPLAERGDQLNASEFRGFELEVRGTGSDYFLHLRTSRNRQPWAHYAAALPVSRQWQTVRVPFDSFRPDFSTRRTLPDLRRLTSVAVVAGNAEFDADISVRRIGMYR